MADTATLSRNPAVSAPRKFTEAEMAAILRAGIITDGGPEVWTDGDIRTGGVRRAWTWSEMLALMKAGVLESGGPEELLDGDIWLMASEGQAHSALKVWLNEALVLGKPGDVTVSCDTSIPFAPRHTPSPDFALFPSHLKVYEARGPDMMLVIEIAESSLADDLRIKAAQYRAYGVREYWVIDLSAAVTHVHLLDGGWPVAPPTPFEAPLAPVLAPGLCLRLADAGL